MEQSILEKIKEDCVKPEFDAYIDGCIKALSGYTLNNFIEKTNPYLLMSSYDGDIDSIVRHFFESNFESSRQTLWGTFMERLGIYTSQCFYSGVKAGKGCTDLQFFSKEGWRDVSIKGSPAWANKDQIDSMKQYCQSQMRSSGTNRGEKFTKENFVVACLYGKKKKKDCKDFIQISGKDAWALLTGDENAYIEILKSFPHEYMEEKEREVQEILRQKINEITDDFKKSFVVDGLINWEKIVRICCDNSNNDLQNKCIASDTYTLYANTKPTETKIATIYFGKPVKNIEKKEYKVIKKLLKESLAADELYLEEKNFAVRYESDKAKDVLRCCEYFLTGWDGKKYYENDDCICVSGVSETVGIEPGLFD